MSYLDYDAMTLEQRAAIRKKAEYALKACSRDTSEAYNVLRYAKAGVYSVNNPDECKDGWIDDKTYVEYKKD